MIDVALVRERAQSLRALHDRSRVLVLPNAWDVVSARVVESAGFPAVATSSASVAWSLGYPDGERIPRDEMIAVAARIARAVRVPVTADLEAGYGDPGATVEAALVAGVVGMNLEDGTDDARSPLLDMAVAIDRIRQARAAADRAGVPFVINARTDVFLRQVGEASTRLERALERARAFREAGADCIFVPGVDDAATIGALARGIDCALNVLARSTSPSVAELSQLGVARVSLGSGAACIALTAFQAAARDLRERGSFDCLKGVTTHAEFNRLLSANR
ncbi:MAG TPA: isocitrate lyase/phosphoenolpyruvate mutase family protein [Polyangiaceae bacterium]